MNKSLLLKIFALVLAVCGAMFIFTACELIENADGGNNIQIEKPEEQEKENPTPDDEEEDTPDKEEEKQPPKNDDEEEEEENPDPETPSHTHVFDQQVAEDKYLRVAASCTEKAIYYLSCKCGEKGSFMFEHGSVLNHDFKNYVFNNDAKCEANGTETATCERNFCLATDTREKDNSALGHNFDAWTTNNDRTHTRICLNDSTHTETEICFDESALIEELSCSLAYANIGIPPCATCEKCHYEEEGKFVFVHSFETTLLYNNEQHWDDCSVCCKRENYVDHTLVDGKCSCGYEDTTYSIGLRYYLLDNDTYMVTGLGTCTHKELIIPPTHNGKAVTRIGTHAFIVAKSCPPLGSYIYYYDDEDCSTLTSITIPSTITNIGEEAFSCRFSLTTIKFDGTVEEWNAISFNDWHMFDETIIPETKVECTNGDVIIERQ